VEYEKLDASKRMGIVNARLLQEEQQHYNATLTLAIIESLPEDMKDAPAAAAQRAMIARTEASLVVLRAAWREAEAAGGVDGQEVAGPVAAGGGPGRRGMGGMMGNG